MPQKDRLTSMIGAHIAITTPILFLAAHNNMISGMIPYMNDSFSFIHNVFTMREELVPTIN
jgi:hypothetical protein